MRSALKASSVGPPGSADATTRVEIRGRIRHLWGSLEVREYSHDASGFDEPRKRATRAETQGYVDCDGEAFVLQEHRCRAEVVAKHSECCVMIIDWSVQYRAR